MKKILAFLLLLCGCTVTQPVEAPKHTFVFDYTPKQMSKGGSAGMVLAFIQPYYAKRFPSGGNELFRRFRESLSHDIDATIIAKGFTLKGPYASLDEILYGDKKIIDLIISIEIDPEFVAAQGTWQQHFSIPTNYFTYSGKVSLVGKINIMGVEPMTGQRIISPSVSIPNITNIPIATTGRYTRQMQDYEIMQDAGVYNAVGDALTQQYKGIMDKINAYLDVEELKSHKGEIKELKSKKGY